MNHLYVLPRYAVLPKHAAKAFIPYTNVFRGPGAPTSDLNGDTENREVLLYAQVTALGPHSVTLSMSTPCPELELYGDHEVLEFDYAVYALGSDLPAPINLWGRVRDTEAREDPTIMSVRGTKTGGVEWLRKFNDVIREAPSVLVVGGGALGIRAYSVYLHDEVETSCDRQSTQRTSRRSSHASPSLFFTRERSCCRASRRACTRKVGSSMELFVSWKRADSNT